MSRISLPLTKLPGQYHLQPRCLFSVPASLHQCSGYHRLSKNISYRSFQKNHRSARCQFYPLSSGRSGIEINGHLLSENSNAVIDQWKRPHVRVRSRHDHTQCRQFCTEGIVGVNLDCLKGVKDRFNGVWVDLGQTGGSLANHERITAEIFDKMLSNSLDVWRSENVSSVWIKVPIALSHMIAVSGKHGFLYHHAEGAMAVLCLWLDNTTESRIPRFATHQVGVSGVVINEETRDVLVVKDKNKKYNVWKFPGGLSDLGEDIAQTAVREVYEETGIQTEFKSILAFRQQHDQRNAYGRSDIYILCRLKPLTFDLTPCEEEIEAAQWMSIDKLLEHEETSAFSRHMASLVVRGLEQGFQHVDITANWTKSVFKTDMQLFHRSIED